MNPYLEVVLVVVIFIGISFYRSFVWRKKYRRRAKERRAKMKKMISPTP